MSMRAMQVIRRQLLDSFQRPIFWTMGLFINPLAVDLAASEGVKKRILAAKQGQSLKPLRMSEKSTLGLKFFVEISLKIWYNTYRGEVIEI